VNEALRLLDQLRELEPDKTLADHHRFGALCSCESELVIEALTCYAAHTAMCKEMTS
jgi:hypothetical protein